MKNKKHATLLLDPTFETMQSESYGACKHYPLMSVAEVRDMPIGDLAEDIAHCWLWVSNPTLRVGFEILEKWGSTPRSVFTWVKTRMGLGVYLRNVTEHIILGTRGKAPINFKAQINWGIFPIQDHCHKPERSMTSLSG